MSKPKKQHWVPRFYLKEFSIHESQKKRESQVWIFSKGEGDPKIVNIKDIASKRYLYSPQDKEGNRSWEMEDKLASLESLLSEIWPKFANGFLDLNNQAFRKAISLFLATLYLRHPKRLPEQEELQNRLINFFDQNLPKDANGSPVAFQFVCSKGEVEIDPSDWNNYSNPSQYDKESFFVNTIQESAREIAEILMEKRWSVIYSESKQFITTDNPLIISNRLTGEIKNNGFKIKGTTITIPISPTRVLILDDLFDEAHSKYYQLEGNGTDINILSWMNAHQFMISHRDPDEVSYEMVTYIDAQKNI